MIAATVIIFGRTRSTAPSMIAAYRSSRVNVPAFSLSQRACVQLIADRDRSA